MRLPVHVEPLAGAPREVVYRWDPDTDILSARVNVPMVSERLVALPAVVDSPVAAPPLEDPAPALPLRFGAEDALSGAVEVEGRDGSWIVLDVERGHLAGIEVAVWPNIRRRPELAPPAAVEDANIRVTGRRGPGGRAAAGPSSLEVTTHVTAEADVAERIIHFRLGPQREARAVRLGRDLLVDVDAEGHLAGLWLLNVPPVPTVT